MRIQYLLKVHYLRPSIYRGSPEGALSMRKKFKGPRSTQNVPKLFCLLSTSQILFVFKGTFNIPYP